MNKSASDNNSAAAGDSATNPSSPASPGEKSSTNSNAPLHSGGMRAGEQIEYSRSASDAPVFKNGAPPGSYPTLDKRDPWESVNRSIFTFNETLDGKLLRPVAQGYKWITPDPLEFAISNAFSNLNDIPVTLNNILQFKFNNAMRSTGRFLVNTTIGLGGIMDLATDLGLPKQNEDFGQTLGYYGISDGPYIVLPLIGPSSARDAGGLVVDFASDVVAVGSFFVAPFIGPIVGATRFADTRARWLDNDKTLDEAALDKYVFTREAYLQRRRNLVYDGSPPQHIEDEDY